MASKKKEANTIKKKNWEIKKEKKLILKDFLVSPSFKEFVKKYRNEWKMIVYKTDTIAKCNCKSDEACVACSYVIFFPPHAASCNTNRRVNRFLILNPSMPKEMC